MRTEYQKKWRLDNIEHCLAYSKQYAKDHKEEFQAYWRKAYHKLKDQVLEKYGNRCNNPECKWINEDGTIGCTDKLCLQIEHVNNDGFLDRRRNQGSQRYFRKVLDDTTGRYQIYCANCNWIKRGKLTK